MDREIDLKKQFSHELEDLTYKLQQLEQGRIMERTGAKGDGKLEHNVRQLKDMLADLFFKIEGKRPSTEDVFAEYFGEK